MCPMEDMYRNHREKCASFGENRRCLIAVTSASAKPDVKAIKAMLVLLVTVVCKFDLDHEGEVMG